MRVAPCRGRTLREPCPKLERVAGRPRPHEMGLLLGKGRTPPMGFNPWTAFGTDINQAVLLEVADAMIATGLRDAGHAHSNSTYDDCRLTSTGPTKSA